MVSILKKSQTLFSPSPYQFWPFRVHFRDGTTVLYKSAWRVAKLNNITQTQQFTLFFVNSLRIESSVMPNPSQTRKNLIILGVNPRAGTGKGTEKLDELVQALQDSGFEVEQTTDLRTLDAYVEAGQNTGKLRAVVACGGDGTVRLLVDRLGTKIPFSVFPLGTENLLAKHFGITTDVGKFCKILTSSQPIKIDVGRANGQIFLSMVSAGFDADVVRRLHAERTGPIHHTSYFWPVWKSIFAYRFPPIEIQVDGEKVEPGRWTFIFNLPRYALNLALAPDARADDGLLEIKVFDKGGFWNGMAYFFSVLFRRDGRPAKSRHLRGRVIELASTSKVPFQIDGDAGGELPLRVELLPEQLELLVPE